MTGIQDKVASTVHEALSDYLNRELGHGLRSLTWDGDEDDDDPDQPLIVKDSEGRRFEIELDVQVTELTEAELARRAHLAARLEAKDEAANTAAAHARLLTRCDELDEVSTTDVRALLAGGEQT